MYVICKCVYVFKKCMIFIILFLENLSHEKKTKFPSKLFSLFRSKIGFFKCMCENRKKFCLCLVNKYIYTCLKDVIHDI